MGAQDSSDFDAGVLRSLVDFRFQSFATPRLIRILYAISFVVVALFRVGETTSRMVALLEPGAGPGGTTGGAPGVGPGGSGNPPPPAPRA